MKGSFHYKKVTASSVSSPIRDRIYVKKGGGPFDLPLKDFIAKAKESRHDPGGDQATWSGDDFARAILEGRPV
jgi:hypothetical protein